MSVEKEMRMNASIKRYVYVFLHIIMWGIVFAGPFFPPYHPHIRESGFILMHFIKVGTMCCFFYANYFFLIDILLFKNKFARFFALNLLLIVACSLFTHFLFGIIGSHRHIISVSFSGFFCPVSPSCLPTSARWRTSLWCFAIPYLC